jgi:hypothetical protein
MQKQFSNILDIANISYEATKFAFTLGYALDFLNQKTETLKEALLALIRLLDKSLG